MVGRHLAAAVIGLAGLLSMAIPGVARAQPQKDSACREIRQACEQAGFAPGAGLQRDCYAPLVKGAAAAPKRPLPSVAPDLIARCRGGSASDATPAAMTRSPGLPAPSPVPPTPSARGIIVFREQVTSDTDAQFLKALAVPGVDAMAVIVDWSQVQPNATGQLDTTILGPQLIDAQRFRLPIELVIRAGASTPSWVSPAAQVKLAYAPHNGLGNCKVIVTAPPWDPGYQAAFAAMLQKVTKLVGDSHVSIAAVKLTGINATTEELRLPAEDAAATKGCAGGAVDDVAAWKSAGYDQTKLVAAFDQLARTFARQYPQTPVMVALIPHAPFPPIDPKGAVVRGKAKGTLTDTTLDQLVGDGAAALPGRFVLQFDYLMTDQPANAKVVGLAVKHRLPLAWQTNLWRGRFGQGAGCGPPITKAKVCRDADYLNLLEQGIHPQGGSGASAQGLYIEVFAYDAIAHPAAIAQAHRELTGQPGLTPPKGLPPPCLKPGGCPPPV